jgi:zinc protease
MQSRSVSRSQDAELVRNLNGQTFLDRTMAWDADLEKRVMALDAGQIRAALNRYLLPAKFTVVKAGDFAGAAAKKPAN